MNHPSSTGCDQAGIAVNGAISDEARGRAVIDAAEKGHLDIVKTLLVNGDIPTEAREQAAAAAAKNGHLLIVEILLVNGPLLTKETRTSIGKFESFILSAFAIAAFFFYFHAKTAS